MRPFSHNDFSRPQVADSVFHRLDPQADGHGKKMAGNWEGWMSRASGVLSAFVFVFLALVLLALSPSGAAAQQPTPSDDEVNRLAKEMYCPVCENVPLDVCPTQACAQWRALIRQKMAEGLSDAEIKEYFVLQYGDRVLAEPPRRGLNWLVYILPPVFFLGGAFIVYNVLRKMRTQALEIDLPADALDTLADDPYLEKLEEELKRRQENGR